MLRSLQEVLALCSLLELAQSYRISSRRSRAEANPPNWGPWVKIYSPSDNIADIQAGIDDSWNKNGGQNQWGEPTARYSPYRFSFLFKPGNYSVDFPMGYYVHVAGIGATPEDVVFEGGSGPHTPCNNMLPGPGQLVTFWRTAERFKRVGNMDWFVSQAAPVRDVHITGDLNLWYPGSYGSGGYLANAIVDGTIQGGSQQQFFARNLYVGNTWNGIEYNTVLVGAQSGANSSRFDDSRCHGYKPDAQTVVIDKVPLVAEKPFIAVDANDDSKYNLHVPHAKVNSTGPSFVDPATIYPFEQVYVTRESDTATQINAKLASGLHVVISPGVYNLDVALKVQHDDQVLLCLGLASLIPTHGTAAIEVASGIGGVRVAGCILQASPVESPQLLKWGDKGATSSPTPSFIFDVFTRVGGPAFEGHRGNDAAADTMVEINSDDIYADHLWLWRGDHYLDATQNTDANTFDPIGMTRLGDLHNPHAITVSGDRVTIYGLFAEHSTEEQVVWSGEDGKVYFFQCEIPYDVDQEWERHEYAAYKVTDGVQRHQAWGVGVYSFFRDFPVFMKNAFEVPPAVKDHIHYPFVLKLFEGDEAFYNGGSGIRHTLNGEGPAVGLTGQRYEFHMMCNWNGVNPGPGPSPPGTPLPTPAPTPCNPQDCFECNVDYNGNDIHDGGWPYNASSSNACQDLCAQDSGCYFFGFRPSTGHCWLKDSNAGAVGKDDSVAGPKQCGQTPRPTTAPTPTPAPTEAPTTAPTSAPTQPPAPTPGCWQVDIDYSGNDLQWPSPWSASSAAGCQAHCAQESACQVFTYKPSDGGCFLKSAKGGETYHEDRISGPKDCDPSPTPAPTTTTEAAPAPTPPTPPTPVSPGTVFVKSYHNNYLQDRQGSASLSSSMEDWEKWAMEDAGDGKVYLRGHTGAYLSSEWDGSSRQGTATMTTSRGEAAKWTRESTGTGIFWLKDSHGNYLTDLTGVLSTIDTRADWEKWTFVEV